MQKAATKEHLVPRNLLNFHSAGTADYEGLLPLRVVLLLVCCGLDQVGERPTKY